MQGWWAGLRKDVWLAIGLCVVLMSGIASIGREALATFYPHAASPNRLFSFCLWTCFVLSNWFVIVRQRFSIAALESASDQSSAIKKENKRLHDLFGEFMVGGESLSKELKQTHGDKFGAWLRDRQKWIEKICQALVDMNLPTEASAFRHAGEKDPKVGPGIVLDDRYWHQLYNDQLNGYRNQLKDIVTRRLS